MAIRYIVDAENKVIELLSGDSSVEEIRDLIELFKDYKFSVSLPFSPPKIEIRTENTLEKQGVVVGAKYVSIIGNKDYN